MSDELEISIRKRNEGNSVYDLTIEHKRSGLKAVAILTKDELKNVRNEVVEALESK